MMLPSREIVAPKLPAFPSSPAVLTDTRMTLPVILFQRMMSKIPLLSPLTRSVAAEVNVTQRPVAEMAGSMLWPFPTSPAGVADTNVVVPVTRSRRKMSGDSLPSPGTRLSANDSNAT